MPFEERFGEQAVALVRAWMRTAGLGMVEPPLVDGSFAWGIACALQAAHTTGVQVGIDESTKVPR